MQQRFYFEYNSNGNLSRTEFANDKLYQGQQAAAEYSLKMADATDANNWLPSDSVFINFTRPDGKMASVRMTYDSEFSGWKIVTNGWETDVDISTSSNLTVSFTARRYSTVDATLLVKQFTSEAVVLTIYATAGYTPLNIAADDSDSIHAELSAHETRLGELENIIDEAIASDSPVEVTQARTNASGTTFDTLQARLNAADAVTAGNTENITANAEDIAGIETSKADLNYVNEELSQRALKSYVDDQITAIGDGSPKGVYATLTDLQTAFPTGTTGIYVVSADAHWYYWNGSAWADGNVYQADKIATGGVTAHNLSAALQRRNNMIPFNSNPVFDTVSQWEQSGTETAYTATWGANDQFVLGDYYLAFSTTSSGPNTFVQYVLPKNILYGDKIRTEVAIIADKTTYMYVAFLSPAGAQISTSYVSVAASTTETIIEKIDTVPNNAATVKIILLATAATYSLKAGSLYCGKYETNIDTVINEKLAYHGLSDGGTDITVKTSGGDFTTIAEAIEYANTFATMSNPVNILIDAGTWNEINLTLGAHYINLIGQGIDKTIIYADGDTLASDQASAHGIMCRYNGHHKNFTVTGKTIRYALHDDNRPGAKQIIFENIKFKIDTPNSGTMSMPVGMGAHALSHHYFKNCIFEISGAASTTDTFKSFGIFWHNWATQGAPCSLEVSDSKFINCGMGYIFENGSGHPDSVKFINCKSNLPHKGFMFRAAAVETPYNIDMQISSDTNNLEYYNTTRVNGDFHAENFYDLKVKNADSVTIPQGYGIYYDYANLGVNILTAKLAVSGYIDGVAGVDIEAGSEGYIIKNGKACKVFVLAEAYTKGDMLKCNSNGIFEKTLNISERVAVVVNTLTIAENGLIDALLI